MDVGGCKFLSILGIYMLKSTSVTPPLRPLIELAEELVERNIQRIYCSVYGIHRVSIVFPPGRIVAAGTEAGLAIELSRATIASPITTRMAPHDGYKGTKNACLGQSASLITARYPHCHLLPCPGHSRPLSSCVRGSHSWAVFLAYHIGRVQFHQ
jgi:hypothetical protein